MAKLLHWVWFSLLTQLSPLERSALLEYFGDPERVSLAEKTQLERIPWLSAAGARQISELTLGKAEYVLESCGRRNISVITMQDAAYPERLANIPDPPSVLYYKGRFPNFDEETAIAVVGTRSFTRYGYELARELAGGLSAGGAYVASGAARGIDSAAHTGALDAGCGTSAVLGCGCDVVYPSENAELYERICAAGALISEYPPGTRPLSANFPRRNRILSGLCCGTLVVEAARRSGALITARMALEQGRDVFAVPGAPDVPTSEGANMLIRDSSAKLVTCAEDVLCEYSGLSSRTRERRGAAESGGETKTAAAQREKAFVPDPEKIKSFTERQLDIILKLADGPKTAEELTDALEIAAGELLAELTLLQIEGAVRAAAGGSYAPDPEYFGRKP